jgi:NTP pyrophosphatase (non-canonical NTP hydrolase)
MDLRQLQEEQKEWVEYNFLHGRKNDSSRPLFGVMEELGELSHAHLKQMQNIRGTVEEHELAAKDAIGDLMIFLADYCTSRDFDLQQIVEETWNEVKKRNWVKYPKDGISE